MNHEITTFYPLQVCYVRHKHVMDPNSILNYPLSENRESRIFNFLISKKVGSIVSRVAGVGGGGSTLPCSKSKQETGDRVSLFFAISLHRQI